MVEIILFTCSVGDQVGFVVQFILSALSTLSEFVLNDARVELGQELVGEQEPALIAQRFPGVSQIHPSSKDASLVLCNSQLFCSGAMAEPGEVFAVQPQCCLLKAEEHLGPARAGSGEQDFSCPLGMGFLTVGILSLGEPSILHPLLTQTKPNRAGAACDAPFAGKAWEWHLDLIIQLAPALV